MSHGADQLEYIDLSPMKANQNNQQVSKPTECRTLSEMSVEHLDVLRSDINELVKCELVTNEIYSDDNGNTEKSNESTMKTTCQSCGHSFKKMRLHRCKAGIQYPCDICGKFFAHTSSLNAHKRLHLGVKYTCETCGKSLTTKNSYVSHQQRHLQIKPFVCDFCNKNFVKKHYLMEHRRVHLGIRPYVCKTCGKTFTRNTHLTMHMGAHQLQHKCGVCNKTFTRNGQLKEHKRVHTGEKPYKCEVCHKSYTRKSHLVNHKCIPISVEVAEQSVDEPSGEESSNDDTFVPIDKISVCGN